MDFHSDLSSQKISSKTGIADTTGTELAVHQISFKEYKNNLKFNGDNGDGGDTTYSIYIYRNILLTILLLLLLLIIIIIIIIIIIVIIIIISSSSSSSSSGWEVYLTNYMRNLKVAREARSKRPITFYF